MLPEEIKIEIERLCRAAVNGRYVDVRRIDELFRKHPKEFAEISDKVRAEENKKVREFYNSLGEKE